MSGRAKRGRRVAEIRVSTAISFRQRRAREGGAPVAPLSTTNGSRITEPSRDAYENTSVGADETEIENDGLATKGFASSASATIKIVGVLRARNKAATRPTKLSRGATHAAKGVRKTIQRAKVFPNRSGVANPKLSNRRMGGVVIVNSLRWVNPRRTGFGRSRVVISATVFRSLARWSRLVRPLAGPHSKTVMPA